MGSCCVRSKDSKHEPRLGDCVEPLFSSSNKSNGRLTGKRQVYSSFLIENIASGKPVWNSECIFDHLWKPGCRRRSFVLIPMHVSLILQSACVCMTLGRCFTYNNVRVKIERGIGSRTAEDVSSRRLDFPRRRCAVNCRASAFPRARALRKWRRLPIYRTRG